ncbi:MAG: winged helix-turn-helix transcriptional regulator [archaeon]
MKIDKYDRKILFELDSNSRQSAQQIARKVKLSKVSVINRINKLKKQGIIRNFLTLVDYRKLGYTNYHVYYSLQNLSQEKEEEFIAFLKKEKEVRYVIQIDSRWDLMLALFTESNEQTDSILNRINENYGEYIKDIRIYTIITTFYPGRNYLVQEKGKPFNTPLVRKKVEKAKIDEIDHNILKNISKDARIPLTDLSKKIKIRAEVLRYHLKNLIKRGIIQRFTIDFNHEAYGNSFYKLLFKLNPGLKEELFMRYISQYKSSLRIHHFMGEKMIEADFEVDNDKEIRNLIKGIKERFGDKIQELEILPVYAIRKIDYYQRM